MGIREQLQQLKEGRVLNRAGGWVQPISDKELLERFLILGNDQNTYYASAQELSVDALGRLLPYIKRNVEEAVDVIRHVSEQNLAPKNRYAVIMLAIAACLAETDQERRAVRDAVPTVIRNGGELLLFASVIDAYGGWGRFKRGLIETWFNSKTPEHVALTMVKYPQRKGWAMKDVLRLAHPEPANNLVNMVYRWVTHPPARIEEYEGEVGRLFKAKELLKQAETVDEVVRLIREYRPPREAIPNTWFSSAEVWRELIPHTPVLGLLRALPVLTTKGVFDRYGSEALSVIERIFEKDYRNIHPLRWYYATDTYRKGAGTGQTWTPNGNVAGLLERMTNKAFRDYMPDVEGMRILVAIDASGSMRGIIHYAAAMAYTFRNVAELMLFDWKGRFGFHTDLLASRSIFGLADGVWRVQMEKYNGGTDVTLPFTYLANSSKEYDAVVLFTDNETWANNLPIDEYIATVFHKRCPNTKVIVNAMTLTDYTVNATDRNTLNVVGFDPMVAEVTTWFITGSGAGVGDNTDEE